MVDVDTFLTTLYVMVDDFCKTSLPPETPPGPEAALSRSETVTLAIFGQWQGFGSARGFYRYAQRHLRPAFPQLPTREQFNRQVRQHDAALVACFLYLGRLLAAQHCLYEALDSSGLPTRDAKRRGAGLDRERPHELSGFQARLAAKIALHNFCIWLNEQLGRPRLAFTDLVDW